MDIVEAQPSDLQALLEVADAALPLESLSDDLLREKLFGNPFPDRDVYQTFVARVDGRTVGFLQHVYSQAQPLAWLGLFAVVPSYLRQGIGRSMFEAARSVWLDRDIETVDALGVPSNYLVPGLDVRYEDASRFLEALGFEVRGEVANLLAKLDQDFDTTRKETDLARAGITIRRAVPEDDAALVAFFDRQFGEMWLAEARLGQMESPQALHLAFKDDEIVGFASHSTMNRSWGFFGPIGTSEAVRGTGAGGVLLCRCMADLKQAGHSTAIIPWVGPIEFYRKFLDCETVRTFRQYRLKLRS